MKGAYTMNDKIIFTQEEMQLLYNACMSYGYKLNEIALNLSNEPDITDLLEDKAKDSWELASKITEYMEEE
jgi:hypothetical protein